MNDSAAAKPGRHLLAIVIFSPILLLAASGVFFAGHQDVWIDESTQLLGSALPLSRMLAWLGGAAEPLGVPPDRMPPISYLADWTWMRIVSPAPIGLRLFHLSIVLAGVGLLTWIAFRRNGWAAGLVTGLFLALAPQMTAVGVEIRAYPWFFSLTAIQLALVYRLFDARPIRPVALVPLLIVSIIAAYTHFFGLVSSSALFVGLLVAAARKRGEILAIGGAWALFLVSAVGLAPFVRGAKSASPAADPVETSGRVGLIARYVLRLVGDAPMMLHPALAVLFYVCVGLLAAIAVYRLALAAPRSLWRDSWPPEAAVLVAILAGVGVTTAAAMVSHGFNPLKPSYSIWLLAPIALLLGSACAAAGRLGKVAGALAVGLILALLVMQLDFLRRADWFIHGPGRAIADEIGSDPRGTAIVYDGPAWAIGYYPLIYRYGPGLQHYLVAGPAKVRPIGPGGDPNRPALPVATLDDFSRVVMVSIALHKASDLPAISADRSLVPEAASNIIALPQGWRQDRAKVVPGIYSLRMSRFERISPR